MREGRPRLRARGRRAPWTAGPHDLAGNGRPAPAGVASRVLTDPRCLRLSRTPRRSDDAPDRAGSRCLRAGSEHGLMPLTDSATTTRRLVETFFRRLSERDPDAVAELFSDDVDWYIPGNQELASWLGRRSSRKDVAEFFRLLWENAEPITAHVDHVLVDENVAIVTGSFSSRMRRTGKTFVSI